MRIRWSGARLNQKINTKLARTLCKLYNKCVFPLWRHTELFCHTQCEQINKHVNSDFTRRILSAKENICCAQFI